jgi:SET domain-containing protein
MKEKLKVRVTKSMGRGMFATEAIKKGVCVHSAEIVLFKCSEIQRIKKLGQYVYNFDSTHSALALGYGSLFNHSFNSNLCAQYREKSDRWVLTYIATRDIKKGEQLFIYYGADIKDYL